MRNIKPITAGIFSLYLSTMAQAASEVEPNNLFNEAQRVAGSGEYTIDAMMNGSENDVDFFSFTATAGDIIDLDIDHGDDGSGSLDSIMAIFDSNGTLLRMNDNASDVDAGSLSVLDARIDKFTVPASGTYVVGVSTFPRFFFNGGSSFGFTGSMPSDGSYTLNISPAQSAVRVQQINIEVKPGSRDLTPLNPRAQGKLPVAIMGSSSVHVSDIKHDSLTFGSTGNEKSLSKCQKVATDINRDGYADLICHFEISASGFSVGDIEGILKGKTQQGTMFEGRAPLKVLPTRRR